MKKTATEELIEFICTLTEEQVKKIMEHWEEIVNELKEGSVSTWSEILNKGNVSRET